MLEDMRAAVTDARVHVLVGHPEPDPRYLGGSLLGDVEVNVHVLVVYYRSAAATGTCRMPLR